MKRLMIEPTETEAKETLDAFAEAMLKIAQEAHTEPESLEVGAALDALRPLGRSPGRQRTGACAAVRNLRPQASLA